MRIKQSDEQYSQTDTNAAKSIPLAKQLAQALLKHVEHEAENLRNNIHSALIGQDPEIRDHTHAAMEAMESGDTELLKAYGIDLRYCWPEDVINACISEDTALSIQIYIPDKTIHVGKQIEVVSKRLNKLFTPITKAMPQVTIAASGGHYNTKTIDILLNQLHTSSYGVVTIDSDGNTYFKPSRHLIVTSALQDRARCNELLKHGILIRRADSSLTTQSLNALAYLDKQHTKATRLYVFDRTFTPEEDKTYVLLRALSMVKQEDHHDIFYDSTILSPELIAYAIATLFMRYTQRFLNLFDYYDGWHHFDPYEYAMRNYGETLLPEDDNIIHGIVDAFKYINVQPKSLKRVADVGTGSNLYPLMFIAPYVKDNATIEALEFAQPNRAYLRHTIDGSIQKDHRHIWKKFENLMIETGGSLYVGCEQRAKKLTTVKSSNIFTLPEGRYDFVSSYFCTESIVDSIAPFRKSIQSLVNSLAPGGILITAHVVGSEGYYAGEGTRFPAVNIGIEDIAQAFRDADMDFVVIPTAQDTTLKFRDGYHGLAFVIAFARPCSSANQAALDRLAAIPGSVRSATSYDYSVEYCHIYTNESIGPEHGQSIQRLDAITKKLDDSRATYNLCVMVDDYSFPGQNFDYAKLLEWMEGKDARPHFLVREAELIGAAEEVLTLMAESKKKRELTNYVRKKAYPCSLFIAAWYLARLGKLKKSPASMTSHAERLINILPLRFDPYESEAREIIALTPFKDCLECIANEYLEGETLPSV